MARAAALGGWTRLGIVLSIPLCLLAGILQWESDKEFTRSFRYSAPKEQAARARVEKALAREAAEESARKSGKAPPLLGNLALIANDSPDQRQARIFWNAVEKELDLSQCATPAKSQWWQYSGDYSIACDTFPNLFKVLVVALLPAGILFALGAVISWVFRGFRGQKAI